MCKIIAIANQKGGVAKTTTTINLGVGLSKVGKRVMLIDADPQGHLTMGLGFSKNLRVTLKTMMENIIMGLEFDPREAILHHEEGIDVIPSNKLLSGMDMSLFTVEDREKVLKEYLELLENDYDYILIDCMPSLGMMTINALSAADSVLIPVQPQYYAADGLMELLKVVKGIHQRFNPDLQIEGILFTMDSSHYNNYSNGLDYILVGEIYLPLIAVPEEKREIGFYGSLHRNYLKDYKSGLYSYLTLSGKLWTYLADLNEQCLERRDFLMEQIMEQEGITKELKSRDQMEWVRRANNARSRVDEIILNELVYV